MNPSKIATFMVASLLLSYFSFSQNASVKSYKKISDTQGNFSGTLIDTARFGSAVANIGDLNNDGVTDFAVGAEYDTDGGIGRGAVWILFMKNDGTVKSYQKISYTQGNFNGYLYNYDHFGCAITSLGDLDKDGITDIAVGAKGDDEGGTSTGSVYVLFLKTDGTVKSYQKINNEFANGSNFTGPLDSLDWFGYSLANIGDFNGDGIVDLAVGAPQDDDYYGSYEYNSDNYGAVWILMLSTDGTVKSYKKISADQNMMPLFHAYLDEGDNFGNSVTVIGDVNGDGINDIAIGAPFTDDGGVGYSANYGAIYILFLDPTTVLKTSAPPQMISSLNGSFTASLDSADYFGISLTAAGDLNGDNIPDVIVGAHQDDDGGTNQGALYSLFLETNGKVKSYQKISETSGNFLGSLDANDQFAYSLAYVGDVNGDNDPDILVGAVYDDDGGADHGAVWLLNLKATHTLTLSTTTYDPVCYGYNTGEATVSVTGGVSPYTYLWDDIYSQTTATAYGLSAGTYSVTVTDYNGTSSTTSVTITQPLTAISISGTVTNTSSGLNNGSINISVSGGTSPYTYNWSNWETSQDVSGLSAGTYNVWVYDDNGCFTVDTFVVSASSSTLTVSGTIKTETGATVNKAIVSLSGNSTSSYTTSSNGTYSFSVSSNKNYTITPSKINDVNTNNGVSTLDILLVQQHILNASLLSSAYKIIAADVNNSKSITTLDILYIQSLILSNTTSFPGNKLWSFVSSDYTFSDPYNPWGFDSTRAYNSITSNYTNQDFIGVKLGDVNNSWDNSINKTSSNKNITFYIEDASGSLGDTIDIKIKLADAIQLLSFQFTLNWDENHLQYLNLEKNGLDNIQLGESQISDGKLGLLWYDKNLTGEEFTDTSTVLTLHFLIKTNSLSNSDLKIDGSMVAEEAIDDAMQPVNIISKNGTLITNGINDEKNSISNISVYPNPTNEEVSISYLNKCKQNISIELYNCIGEKILESNNLLDQGIQKFSINNKEIKGAGIYYLSIRTSNNSIRILKKIIWVD